MLHDKNKYSKPGVLTLAPSEACHLFLVNTYLVWIMFSETEITIDLSLKTNPL